MTESTAATGISPAALHDSKKVLSTVLFLASTNPAAAKSLHGIVKRLLRRRNWEAEAERMDRAGLPVRYFSGALADAIDLPGNLFLLRSQQETFALLSLAENRWQFLDQNGHPLAGVRPEESSEQVEGVMLTLPHPAERSGFASFAGLWPQLRAAWAEVGLASLMINAGQLLLPLFSMLVYDKIAQNGLFETLWSLTIGMTIYMLTDAGMRLVRSWATERISVDLTERSDESLWSRLAAQADLPPGGFPRFISNYRDLTQTRDFVSSSYLLSVADIPFLLLYLMVIGIIAWQLMLVALVLIVIYLLVGLTLQRRQSELSKEAERNTTAKLAYMGESLNALDVIRTTPGSRSFLRRWREMAELTARFDTRRRLAIQHQGMFSASMQTVTSVVILVAGVYLIHAQLISIGKLIACNLLAGRAMAQVASLFVVTGKWQDFTRAAGRMEGSLEPVDETLQCTPRPTIEARISVINISKGYEGRPAALENVSLTIVPGERIALLGKPGAGKSTLLRILSGLSRAESGQILIDGLALDHIARFDRVQWLAYKGQDPVVFAGTLEENLRVSGCTDPQRFALAIWASGLESEFKSGRMSLGMQLEERGNNLSGGQRQKVALARAFAQPSRILLLDEPTLGLDPESERMLAAALPKLLDPLSVMIMTTHSPVMLQTVERIVALDGGKVVADGPRDKLVKLS